MDNNQNFQKSINVLGDGLVDSIAGAVKQVLGASSTLIGGTTQAIGNVVTAVDSGINDLAIPTADKLRTMGINTGKSAVKLGYDSVKDVGGALIEGGKSAAAELKAIVPKGNSNVQTTKPASKDEQLQYIVATENEAKTNLRLAAEARERLNSQTA